MALPEDNKPRFATVPNLGSGKILDSTSANTFGLGTNLITIFTAGAKGSLVDSIRVLSTDSANKVVHLYIIDGVNVIPLGAFTIPLGSGTNGTVVAYDILSNAVNSNLPINPQGKRHCRIPPNATIGIGVSAALTSAKNIWGVCSGLDFE